MDTTKLKHSQDMTRDMTALLSQESPRARAAHLVSTAVLVTAASATTAASAGSAAHTEPRPLAPAFPATTIPIVWLRYPRRPRAGSATTAPLCIDKNSMPTENRGTIQYCNWRERRASRGVEDVLEYESSRT